MTPILFIDRDGTLIFEPHDFQVDHVDKLALKQAGYRFVMVTNQDGLGSDSFSQADFDRSHRLMMELFRSQGITFDDVLICPHRADANCTCRKPKTGLVSGYLAHNGWGRQRSFVIGDRQSDAAVVATLRQFLEILCWI